MTIGDLENEINLQGFVILEEFDEETQECRELWRSTEDSDLIWIPAEYKGRSVNFMYAETRNAKPEYRRAALIVELKKSEEE